MDNEKLTHQSQLVVKSLHHLLTLISVLSPLLVMGLTHPPHTHTLENCKLGKKHQVIPTRWCVGVEHLFIWCKYWFFLIHYFCLWTQLVYYYFKFNAAWSHLYFCKLWWQALNIFFIYFLPCIQLFPSLANTELNGCLWGWKNLKAKWCYVRTQTSYMHKSIDQGHFM